MSLNDPKRQRRKVPLPRDAKRGALKATPFSSQSPEGDGIRPVDAMLADAVNDVVLQDIRKELAKPEPFSRRPSSITELERQAKQMLEAPRHGRRRGSHGAAKDEEGRCLSSHSARSDASSRSDATDRAFQETLVKRLTEAEQKIKVLSAENNHKGAQLQLAQSKLTAMKHANLSKVDVKMVHKIEAENRRLTTQVREMMAFLQDYGLQWVGESPEPPPPGTAATSEPVDASSPEPAATTWNPAAAVASPDGAVEVVEYPFDFALLRKQVDELNMLGGDGSSDVQQVAGADFRLQRKTKLELAFWKDGFQISHGGLRPYSFSHNRAFVQDMLEGFFPYELKEKYPDGTPLDVQDFSWQLFATGERVHRPFSRAGEGQRLGDGERQLAQPAAGERAVARERVSMGQLDQAGSKASKQAAADNFLQNLPKHVIKNGRIISVRGEIAEKIGQAPAAQSAEAAEGESWDGTVDGENSATLKVRFSSQTYVLKMSYESSVQAVIDRVIQMSKISGTSSSDFEIQSMYPKRTFDDASITLEAAGLVPKSAVIMQRKDGSEQA